MHRTAAYRRTISWHHLTAMVQGRGEALHCFVGLQDEGRVAE